MVLLWYLMMILLKTRCNNNNWQKQCQWLQLTIQQKNNNHDHRRKHEHEHKHEHHHKGCCVGVPRCLTSNPRQSMLHWPKHWTFAAWTNQPAEPASWLALGMPWECLRIGQKIVASNNLSSGELLIFPDFPRFSRSKWLFYWWLLDIGGIYNQYSQTSPWRKFQTFSSPTMRHDLQPLRLVIIALSFAGLKSDGNRPKEATLACSSPCSDKSSHSASGTNRLRMGQSLFS